MAEFQEDLNDVVTDRAPGTTTQIENLRNGKIFSAEIEGPIDPIIVQSELGEDLREVIKIHIQGFVTEDCLGANDFVRFVMFGQSQIVQILPGKRQQNPADMFSDFWSQKRTVKDVQ